MATGFPFGDVRLLRRARARSCSACRWSSRWPGPGWPGRPGSPRSGWPRPRRPRIALAAVGLAAWDLFLDPQMVAEGYWPGSTRRRRCPACPASRSATTSAGWWFALVLMAALALAAGRRRRPAPSDAPMFALYLWTYASSRAGPRGLPRPARVGAVGRLGMGAGRGPAGGALARPARRRPGMPRMAGARRRLAAAVAALTAHTVVNARLLRRPAAGAADHRGRVAVLLPLRDEAARVDAVPGALLAQRGVPRLEILVLDDGSTDGTADVVRAVARRPGRAARPARRCRPGWLGKPHACQQLADAAAGRRRAGLRRRRRGARPGRGRRGGRPAADGRVDLLSPYPRIVAAGRASGWCSRCCSGRG